jgi:alpha-tubulin suppressor-like RCC1 family protein
MFLWSYFFWRQVLQEKQVHDMNLAASFSSLACHTILEDTNGRWWCWGDNAFGTLGFGDRDYRKLPQELTFSFPSPVVSVASGWNHNLALTKDKTVLVWGSNRVGQLGLRERDSDYRAIPTRFHPPKDLPVKFIAAGREFSMVVLEDGSLWAFGESTDGQLGQGDSCKHVTPVLIENIPPVEEVWCGRDHVFARANDGNIYSWGYNDDGELGIGDDSVHMVPTINPNLKNFVEIFPGGYHNLGLDNDGCLWSWGRGDKGRLGLRISSDYKTSPQKISFPSRVVTAACGLDFSIALTEVSYKKRCRWENSIAR